MPIEGLGDVLSKIGEIADKVERGASKGMAVGLTRIRDGARRKAPVDTGQLRQMINYTMETGGGSIKGKVIASAEHAPYIEFGTGPRGAASYKGNLPIAYRQSGWTRVNVSAKKAHGRKRYAIYSTGQPARPFLYPALKENEDAAKGDILAGIMEELG